MQMKAKQTQMDASPPPAFISFSLFLFYTAVEPLSLWKLAEGQIYSGKTRYVQLCEQAFRASSENTNHAFGFVFNVWF